MRSLAHTSLLFTVSFDRHTVTFNVQNGYTSVLCLSHDVITPYCSRRVTSNRRKKQLFVFSMAIEKKRPSRAQMGYRRRKNKV